MSKKNQIQLELLLLCPRICQSLETQYWHLDGRPKRFSELLNHLHQLRLRRANQHPQTMSYSSAQCRMAHLPFWQQVAVVVLFDDVLYLPAHDWVVAEWHKLIPPISAGVNMTLTVSVRKKPLVTSGRHTYP